MATVPASVKCPACEKNFGISPPVVKNSGRKQLSALRIWQAFGVTAVALAVAHGWIVYELTYTAPSSKEWSLTPSVTKPETGAVRTAQGKSTRPPHGGPAESVSASDPVNNEPIVASTGEKPATPDTSTPPITFSAAGLWAQEDKSSVKNTAEQGASSPEITQDLPAPVTPSVIPCKSWKEMENRYGSPQSGGGARDR